MIRTTETRLCGHVSGWPSGVAAQSTPARSCPTVPPAAKTAGTAASRLAWAVTVAGAPDRIDGRPERRGFIPVRDATGRAQASPARPQRWPGARRIATMVDGAGRSADPDSTRRTSTVARYTLVYRDDDGENEV